MKVWAPILLTCLVSCQATVRPGIDSHQPAPVTVLGFAMLPADTLAHGRTPFDPQQVQGFSALVDKRDGTFLALADKGLGRMENSADFHLRIYTLRPDFRTAAGGSGRITVEGLVELRDPDRHLPFAITRHFTTDRVLTGADLDPVSLQLASDGTLWLGDQFGPFLLHADRTGRLLHPPIPVPDPLGGGRLRSCRSPDLEEASVVRVMNALAQGTARRPVFSPWYRLVQDGQEAICVPSGHAPPPGGSLARAARRIVDLDSLRAAGFAVVPWTVNQPKQMQELMHWGVDGLISDRPDLLRQVVERFDLNGDGRSGDLLDRDGLIDPGKFDAQGHRGARGLRPENTLPAMEAALDSLVSTLEMDTGITADGVPVLNHDLEILPARCRRTDGLNHRGDSQVLIRDLTAGQIQKTFVCDRLLPDRLHQKNDPALSPVARGYARQNRLPHVYLMPSLQQVFDFVRYYQAHYRAGPGHRHPEARRRWKNAARVRFNIETKLNPREPWRDKSVGPLVFARAVAGVIRANRFEARSDVQSFDARTLRVVHEEHPGIRTVLLMGDDPVQAGKHPDPGDGTNLQPEGTATTPWLAGLPWPYRRTRTTCPVRVQVGGGLRGLSLSHDGRFLWAMLGKNLAGDSPDTLTLFQFDLAAGSFSGLFHRYRLQEHGTSIGDLVMLDERTGLVLEHNESHGGSGHPSIYRIILGRPGEYVTKQRVANLQEVADPHRLAGPGAKQISMPSGSIGGLTVPVAGRMLLVKKNHPSEFVLIRYPGQRR